VETFNGMMLHSYFVMFWQLLKLHTTKDAGGQELQSKTMCIHFSKIRIPKSSSKIFLIFILYVPFILSTYPLGMACPYDGK
jgi:hypothetical protein